MQKLKSALVMAACVAGVLGASVPATAAAAVVTDVQHVQSGLRLDGSVSQGVRLNTCSGGAYQRWDVQGYQFKHVQSGLCLDGSVGYGPRLHACNGSTYQQWRSPSGVDLRHAQSGLCLDGSIGHGVRLNTCNGSTYQQSI
jgi:hypothetical protein